MPAYRVAFFDELERQLAAGGWDLEVLHGAPEGGQASRGDAREGRWSRSVRVRAVQWKNHTVHYRSVVRLAIRSDVVIAELASTNLDTYLVALLRRRALMLWGHGRAYVTEASSLDTRLESWLAKRAGTVFTYTEGGAAFLRDRGHDPERLVVVRNSTDTVALRREVASLTEDEVASFRLDHDLGVGPVASFVGSFDDSKGLPLLFAAAELVHRELPDFRLLVAGGGPLQDLVDEAQTRFLFVRCLPRTDPRTLATIGAVAQCMVIPGRVGLVAVDALALGLPVVTTTFPHHAPEFEYLSSAVSIVAERNAADLARKLVDFLGAPAELESAHRKAMAIGDGLTVEAMARAFANRILASRGQRRSTNAKR